MLLPNIITLIKCNNVDNKFITLYTIDIVYNAYYLYLYIVLFYRNIHIQFRYISYIILFSIYILYNI